MTKIADWTQKMTLVDPQVDLFRGSRPFSGRWPTRGFVTANGAYSTGSGSASPSEGAEFSSSRTMSLSEVLEPSVPARFFLSPRACQGILRRAAKRERALPDDLRTALERVASRAPSPHPTDTMDDEAREETEATTSSHRHYKAEDDADTE